MSLRRTTLIPVFFCAVLSACAGGMGRKVDAVPEQGFIVIGRSLRLQRGRFPLYCGPEALCAVLEHYGRAEDVEVVARQIYDPKRGGTHSIALIQAAARRGFSAQGLTGSVGRIKDAVEQGMPPIISVEIRENLFHYFVVIGYSDSQRVIVCLDYDGRMRLIGYEELQEHWSRTNFDMILVARGSAEVEVRSGDAEYNAGNYGTAEEHYRKGIAIDPENIEALRGLGNCLLQLGRLEEAGRAYEEVLRLSPADSRTLNNLAEVLLQRNVEPERAEELADRAVADFQRSLDRIRKEIASEPDSEERRHLQREEGQRAIVLAFGLDTLAKARFRNDKTVLAAAAWQASLDLLPLSWKDYRARRMLSLSRAHRAMGMTSVARDWLRKALDEAKDGKLRAEIEKEME